MSYITSETKWGEFSSAFLRAMPDIPVHFVSYCFSLNSYNFKIFFLFWFLLHLYIFKTWQQVQTTVSKIWCQCMTTTFFVKILLKMEGTVPSEVTKITAILFWIVLLQCLFLMFVISISELLQWPARLLESSMMNFWSRTTESKNPLTLQCDLSGFCKFLYWLVKLHFDLAIPLTHTALGCCPPVVHCREYMEKREQNIIAIFITLMEIIYAKAKIWLATVLCQRKRIRRKLYNCIHQGILTTFFYAVC